MTHEPFILKIIIQELWFYNRLQLILKIIIYCFSLIIKINVNRCFRLND